LGPVVTQYLVQQVPDLVGVARVVDVPDGSGHRPAFSELLPGQDVAVGLFDGLEALADVLVAVAVLGDADVDLGKILRNLQMELRMDVNKFTNICFRALVFHKT
jgi:hypothetical protein